MKFDKKNLDIITNTMKNYFKSEIGTAAKASLLVEMDNMVRVHVEDEDDFMLWLMNGIPDSTTIEQQYAQCCDLVECLNLKSIYEIVDLWEELLLNACL